ncbi:HIT domain-containing protein [Futiania mangrovi]|uniref:HIT domain-containing protein n=1 Tax=Futiania mangrovi TaxID=2959716 RepID=A0A9J6PK74_9PROT|nr:HIT domain-containing protein [Futiania mangrovii]MCP1336474.1 HIT domain-containing protein [Futiania mangrovii]
MAYDTNNIFARIVRGEIPCKKVCESAHTLAFEDINPQAPVHVLVIPKGPYLNHEAFAANASDAEIADFHRTILEAARKTGVAEGEGGNGYRLITNSGPDAHQEVPHYHVHVVGGAPVGRMLSRRREGA